MTEGVAIRAEHLTKRYRSLGGVRRSREIRALVDCSFELPAGRVAALVGANGAGKTTLLAMVCGLLRPTSGRVRHEGRVAFVAQEKPLYRDYRVADMLRFGRHSNEVWDQRRAERWLDLFAVPPERRCRRLSTGQQAQVALALGLGSRPDVLLLDEPLANLDPLARRVVMGELLAEIAETGTTVVLSTHIVAELPGIADHLLLLAGGRLLLSGAVDELLATHVRRIDLSERPSPISGGLVAAEHLAPGSSAIVRLPTAEPRVPLWHGSVRPITLDELVLAYLAESARGGLLEAG